MIENFMRYFSIRPSNELEVIGHYPQTELRKGYNPTLPNSHWQVKRDEFPNFIPNYELDLHKNAIPTSIISGVGGYHGLLVDDMFKNILKKYKLPDYHFYPIKVYHREKLLDYYWFHYITENLWQYIDADNSKIRIQHSSNINNQIIFPVIDEFYIKKISEISLFKRTKGFEYNIVPEKIVLNNSFDHADIIEIKHLYQYPLISHKLKEALKEAGLTGFETKLYKPLVISQSL